MPVTCYNRGGEESPATGELLLLALSCGRGTKDGFLLVTEGSPSCDLLQLPVPKPTVGMGLVLLHGLQQDSYGTPINSWGKADI